MTTPLESAAGRFAPSPSGDLHAGNLRTALLAWLFARSTGRRFLIRLEDLDRVAAGAAERQLADLAALGLDHDGAVLVQSERTTHYDRAIERLVADGRTYECFCTRREIREAASAPHPSADPAAVAAQLYPGTCRDLTADQIAERRAQGRPSALRLRADVREWTVTDVLHGKYTGVVDDLVLRRNDGVAAYNLAVVVDDVAQGVDQVVRGDDLLTSAPRQAWLTRRLGGRAPVYAHVPLVLGPDGRRLAKRDGAVTLADLTASGLTAGGVLALIGASLGLCAPGERVTAHTLLARFDPDAVPRSPWGWTPPAS